MRHSILILVALAAALPATAQTPDDDTRPAGWQVRLDDPEMGLEDVEFVTEGHGYRVTLGPRAIFFHPGNRATDIYQARATFTQRNVPEHPEAYGLFFGGSDLEGEGQRYTYFLIRQDGSYLIKRRLGDDTRVVVDWTASPEVRTPDGSGGATNALAVVVDRETVRFTVNGEQVEAVARDRIDVEGIVGFRVNHRLDMQVTSFTVDRIPQAGAAAASPAVGTGAATGAHAPSRR